ncbi:hypothetical protein [Plantactinospora sp. B24E8]|uniref:hypothetical protein n=1 Tax=Plantactinospora sp. B24E8 TaxID=3153567 RepID=UPI00325C4564
MTARPPVLPELPVWRRVRRYAVPAEMIEACAAARSAGDWRAGCAAGRIDVGFDLTEVAREHGREAADRIEADLTTLAPDLLRWHLPRVLGGRTSLATDQQWLLSVREGRLGAEPALVLRTPKMVDGSQRLQLTVRPAGRGLLECLDLPPAFWSAEHVTGLAAAYGGSPARMPGFEPDATVRPFDRYATEVDPADPASRAELFDRYVADGDLVSAWAVAGIDLDPVRPEGPDYWLKEFEGTTELLFPVGLPAELQRLRARYGIDRAVLGPMFQYRAAVELRDDGRLAARLPGYRDEHSSWPRVAAVVYDRPVDLELIRHGLLDPAELHPLVRQALFPALPAVAAVPDRVDLRREVSVRCRGEWHTVRHGDGRLDPVAHTPDEVAREQALRALGGPVTGCFAVLEAWRSGTGRLPRQLRELRREVLQRLQHGGSAALTTLLDAGLDPAIRDGRGGTLLHHVRALSDVGAVRQLVDAGVPVNVPDHRGRTELHVTVGDGGTPELVRALLEAGADPQATDSDEMSVVDLAEYKAQMYEDDEDEETVLAEYRHILRIRDVVTEWKDR